MKKQKKNKKELNMEARDVVEVYNGINNRNGASDNEKTGVGSDIIKGRMERNRNFMLGRRKGQLKIYC